jgi:hypothetical protein
MEVPQHRPWTTERWLRRAVYERRIPYHKLGLGRRAPVLIDLNELDDYAEQWLVAPASSTPTPPRRRPRRSAVADRRAA